MPTLRPGRACRSRPAQRYTRHPCEGIPKNFLPQAAQRQEVREKSLLADPELTKAIDSRDRRARQRESVIRSRPKSSA